MSDEVICEKAKSGECDEMACEHFSPHEVIYGTQTPKWYLRDFLEHSYPCTRGFQCEDYRVKCIPVDKKEI